MINKLWINLCGIACLATPLAAQHEVRMNVQQEEKPAIALDIHGVLTKTAIWRMVKTIFCAVCKQPKLICKLHPKTFSSGEYVKYPALRAIYNCHDPRPEMWELARQLKAAGYPIYIFSNIHHVPFADFREALPGYFDMFDGCRVQNGDPALKKPAATAFASCKTLVAQKHPNRNIIFIDDKKTNIRAGQAAGLTGIQFKNMKQLKKELAKQGVVV